MGCGGQCLINGGGGGGMHLKPKGYAAFPPSGQYLRNSSQLEMLWIKLEKVMTALTLTLWAEYALSGQTIYKEHSWWIEEVNCVLGSDIHQNYNLMLCTSLYSFLEAFQENIPYSHKQSKLRHLLSVQDWSFKWDWVVELFGNNQ